MDADEVKAQIADAPMDESTFRHLALGLNILSRDNEFDAVMEAFRAGTRGGRKSKATTRQMEQVYGLHYMVQRCGDPELMGKWEDMIATDLDRKGWNWELWDWLTGTNRRRLGGLDIPSLNMHDGDRNEDEHDEDEHDGG